MAGHDAVVGKTLVSSCLMDRVVASLERKLWEVPVGFKWFTPGLFDGTCCFGGEESAGASFLKRDGSVWSTDNFVSWLHSIRLCVKSLLINRRKSVICSHLADRDSGRLFTRPMRFESLHMQLTQSTQKPRGLFSYEAASKLIYLVLRNIIRKLA